MKKSIIQDAIELRDPALAREALTEIDLLLGSSSDPNERAYLLFSKSSCYGILGRFEEAKEQAALALREQPEDVDTRLVFEHHEGLLFQQQGKYGEALEKLNAVLYGYRERLNEPQLRFMYEDIQQRRAFLSVTVRRFSEAIPILNEVLSFDLDRNGRSDALISLGICYLGLREWELAEDYLLKARGVGVTQERGKRFHYYLGIAYFHMKLLREAKEELQISEAHAADYELSVADVYEWLSTICKHLGETRESEHYARLAKPI